MTGKSEVMPRRANLLDSIYEIGFSKQGIPFKERPLPVASRQMAMVPFRISPWPGDDHEPSAGDFALIGNIACGSHHDKVGKSPILGKQQTSIDSKAVA